jgi:6-phosphogluconolactonase
MSTQIIIKPSQEEVTRAVAKWLIDSIRIVLQGQSTCSIALSGGTTPKRLYATLAETELHSLDWSRVQLFWGDERNVDADHPESNFRMVKEAWLDRAQAVGDPSCVPKFFPVPILPSQPEIAARVYSETLRKEMHTEDPSESVPSLDIVLLGLGDDCHTASLFPETSALEVDDQLFVSNYVPKMDSYRLTMTFSMLNAAKQVAFIVCGASKQAAVEVVWHGPKQTRLYPAQQIQPEQGLLLWFLDTAAVPEHRPGDQAAR